MPIDRKTHRRPTEIYNEHVLRDIWESVLERSATKATRVFNKVYKRSASTQSYPSPTIQTGQIKDKPRPIKMQHQQRQNSIEKCVNIDMLLGITIKKQ